MGRYFLDTNIIVFLILGDYDSISRDTAIILENYSNQLYTNTIVATEILQLYRIKKIKPVNYKTAPELFHAIEKDFYIKILPFGKEHLDILSKLAIPEGHNDPADHAIISHAITEKFILVSSDRKFEHYIKQNLKFAFNKR